MQRPGGVTDDTVAFLVRRAREDKAQGLTTVNIYVHGEEYALSGGLADKNKFGRLACHIMATYPDLAGMYRTVAEHGRELTDDAFDTVLKYWKSRRATVLFEQLLGWVDDRIKDGRGGTMNLAFRELHATPFCIMSLYARDIDKVRPGFFTFRNGAAHAATLYLSILAEHPNFLNYSWEDALDCKPTSRVERTHEQTTDAHV